MTTPNQEEIARLRACLEKANNQAEHFEREWYLRGDELARLREQEPVAWYDDDMDCAYTASELDGGTADGLAPLYRAAPPAQPAEPTIDEQVASVNAVFDAWRNGEDATLTLGLAAQPAHPDEFACPLCFDDPANIKPAEPVQRLSDAGLREKLHDALASELEYGAYDCTRVWEAWSVGTMSQDDFVPVTERLDDIVSTVLAAIESALQPGWRDIESAPKDELILVGPTKRMGICVAMHHSRDGWVTETTSEWVTMYTPTHWMPLPAAPKASHDPR